MIVLFGSHGYIGSAFAAEMRERGIEFVAGDYRHQNWTCPDVPNGAELVINCAAFIPKTSVADCDCFPTSTMLGNVILPDVLARRCRAQFIPIAHISTGCLWSDEMEHSEDDTPQRSFEGHCGFYIGTKAMAESAVASRCPEHYIWRVRLPFDEFDSDRNYLSKLATLEAVWDHENTFCHRRDFAKACLDLWGLRAPFGTYHVMNPGSVKATSIAQRLIERGIRKTPFQIISGPQGGSRLSVKKLLAAGVKIRPVEDALAESLTNWKPAHV